MRPLLLFAVGALVFGIKGTVVLAQDTPTTEAPFQRFQRMITEERCSELIPRLDEEYASGGMPSAENREKYGEATKARVGEYGVTWGLILGYEQDGRLGDEASEIVDQLRSSCEDDPDAFLAQLIDLLG